MGIDRKRTSIDQDQLLQLAEASQSVDIELDRFLLLLSNPNADIADLIESIRKIQNIRKAINDWIRDRAKEMEVLV